MKRFIPTALLAATVLATALGAILTRHESRHEFVELQELEAERDALDIEWGRLQLEQATWAEASRVEKVAREDLGLVTKKPRQVMVIVQ